MEHNWTVAQSKTELVRRGFEAASDGDLVAVGALLDEQVRWHGAGDDEGGCQNREQALRWMSDGISQGIRVELVDARELADGRVLVLLQRMVTSGREEKAPPHGQLVSFRDGKIAEMVVYPTADEALRAAGMA
jgi:ketosteroid isomerase-like protein